MKNLELVNELDEIALGMDDAKNLSVILLDLIFDSNIVEEGSSRESLEAILLYRNLDTYHSLARTLRDKISEQIEVITKLSYELQNKSEVN